MIRNERYDETGMAVAADCFDLTTNTYTREEYGVVTVVRPMTADEIAAYRPQGLDPIGALATLLAVHEVVPVAEAAAAVGLTPDDLTNEAIAWYVAGSP